MEVRLTPGGKTVPEAPPGEGRSVRRAEASEVGEVLRQEESGLAIRDRPTGLELDKEDLKDLLRRTTDVVEALGPSNRHLKYEVIDEAGLVQVQVIDTADGNIVRKIPADEIVNLISRIRETLIHKTLIHETLNERLDVVA